MEYNNSKTVHLILSKLKKEVKCRAQITRSGPSAHALSDPSRRLQKAMNKLVREERIQQLASLLAELRTEIPPENLRRIAITLNRLYRQSPPDDSELAPRETLQALIQALSPTPPTASLNQGGGHRCHRTKESGYFCAVCSKRMGGI